MPTFLKGIYSIINKRVNQSRFHPKKRIIKMVICIILQLKLRLFRRLQMKIERKLNKTVTCFLWSLKPTLSDCYNKINSRVTGRMAIAASIIDTTLLPKMHAWTHQFSTNKPMVVWRIIKLSVTCGWFIN